MKKTMMSVGMIISLTILLIACTTTQSSGDTPRIGKDELKAKLGSAEIVLIDVRTGNDWDKICPQFGCLVGDVQR